MVNEQNEMPEEFGCEVCPDLCEQAAINGSYGNVCGYGWQKYSAEYRARKNIIDGAKTANNK